LQEKCLSILYEFDRICIDNNIKYYIIAGTALGAVRHGGFIPWDDDIDVAVPRRDYERLLLLKDKFPLPYKLESYEKGSSFIYPFIKIYDTSTKVIEPLSRPFSCGVWIDVFPLDGTFEDHFPRCLHLFTIKVLKTLWETKVRAYRKVEKFSLKSIIRLLISLFVLLVPAHVISNFLRKTMTLVQFENSKFGGMLLSSLGLKQIVPTEYYSGPDRLVGFCEQVFHAPSNLEAYLTVLYGEYMIPPPIHDRRAHELIVIDLGNIKE